MLSQAEEFFQRLQFIFRPGHILLRILDILFLQGGLRAVQVGSHTVFCCGNIAAQVKPLRVFLPAQRFNAVAGSAGASRNLVHLVLRFVKFGGARRRGLWRGNTRRLLGSGLGRLLVSESAG